MECLGGDVINTEETKPTSLLKEGVNEVKFLENRSALKNLKQQISEMAKRLQILKVNLVKLDKKRKTVCGYSHGYYPSSTKQSIGRKMGEIWELEDSLYDLIDSKKPAGHRQNSHICSQEEYLLNEQLVKLHKGRLHGSMNLVKERKLLQQIKQATGEKEKICSDSHPIEPEYRVYTYRHRCTDDLMHTSRGYINPYSEKAITDSIKALTREVEELRMNKMRREAYNDRLNLEKEATKKEIRILERKLKIMRKKKVDLSSKLQAMYRS